MFTMSTVVLGWSVSLDGIAGGGNEQEFWPVHEAILGWVFDLKSWRQAQRMDGGVEGVDSDIWQRDFDRFGAQIVGRMMYDFGQEPWGDDPPFHAPVFVHTHRAAERIEKLGGTSYTFVTDGIKAVVEQAKAAAGGRDVLIAGGVRVAQQTLAAGLVDELQLHVAPVVIGRGVLLATRLTPNETTMAPVVSSRGADSRAASTSDPIRMARNAAHNATPHPLSLYCNDPCVPRNRVAKPMTVPVADTRTSSPTNSVRSIAVRRSPRSTSTTTAATPQATMISGSRRMVPGSASRQRNCR